MHIAVCASTRVWPLPGGVPSSHQETEYSFSGFIPTNKQTNKPILFIVSCEGKVGNVQNSLENKSSLIFLEVQKTISTRIFANMEIFKSHIVFFGKKTLNF